ncbi:hypothetical protein GVK98_19550 [Salmonella enterica subsp. arizonae serovar 41:z4,z23:-]|nr:hypothetical protein [Salmonella enterica subsp. arizonae serovar 41:z4,z23:-]
MPDITPNIVVSQPSQLFTLARSFKANADGKIYIGKIDTDPVNPENQIPVYLEREDGTHVQVQQPIVINSAGYPVYNGQIAKFVTVQGHSMAVYDAYGSQQFYYPNVLKYDPDRLRQQLASHAAGNGDELVAVKQPIENSKERTVHDWLADIITAKDGANIIADGINNDAVGINALLPVLSDLQRELILVPGVYLINDDITIDIPVTFQPGAIIKPRNGAQVTFNAEIMAGNYQIFDTEDDFYTEPEAKTSIKITGVNIRPEWFGATTISDVNAILNIADSSSAFRKAFRAATGDFKPIDSTSYRSEFICKKIELSNGHYRMDKPTTHGFHKNNTFYKVNGGGYVGKGMGSSILVYTDLHYEGNSFFDFSYGSWEMHELSGFKCTAYNPLEDDPYYARVGAIMLFGSTDSLITNEIWASGAKYIRNDPDGTRRGGVGIQFESLVDHSFCNLLVEHCINGIAFSSCISTGVNIKGFSNTVSDFAFGNFIPDWPPLSEQITSNVISINGLESKACGATPMFFGTNDNNVVITGLLIDGRAEASLSTVTYQAIGISKSGGVHGTITGIAVNTNYGLIDDIGTGSAGSAGKTLYLNFVISGVYGTIGSEFSVINITNPKSHINATLSLSNSSLPAILSYSSYSTISLSCSGVDGGTQDALIEVKNGNLIINSLDDSGSTYGKLAYVENAVLIIPPIILSTSRIAIKGSGGIIKTTSIIDFT